MPCISQYEDTPTREMQEIESLTQMLCECCRHLESGNGIESISGQLSKWWQQHKIHDEIRLKKEAEKKELDKLKKTALSKLTSEEIKALGLTNKK